MKNRNLVVKLVSAISYLLKSSPLRIVSPANEFTCCLFSLVDGEDLVMVTVVVIAMLIVLVIRLMMSIVIVLPLVMVLVIVLVMVLVLVMVMLTLSHPRQPRVMILCREDVLLSFLSSLQLSLPGDIMMIIAAVNDQIVEVVNKETCCLNKASLSSIGSADTFFL